MNKNTLHFSRLSHNERLKVLIRMGKITQRDAKQFLEGFSLKLNLAERLIENAIGYYHLPLGIAMNFIIDQKPYIIPMAIEETSVIAAASKTAKWIANNGYISTSITGDNVIGQIHFKSLKNYKNFAKTIRMYKKIIIEDVNQTIAANMVKRGGGLNDILIRKLSGLNNEIFAVIHLHINTCDAMGANFINQICEYLKYPIEQLTKEKVAFSILSNLCDTKITTAKVVLENIDHELAEAIIHASHVAYLDPYRAVTNNKGVMNGIDAVLIATGNDWRAVEAAIHAYAVKNKQYRSITQWNVKNNKLIGTLQAPINVGIVGGITRIHPIVKSCMKILDITNANELSRVIAAVGLVQNLGAMRALVTEGICKGHMHLHLTNFCLSNGCNEEQIDKIKPQLEILINEKGYLTSQEILNIIKNGYSNENKKS